jgi:hypothetical protein
VRAAFYQDMSHSQAFIEGNSKIPKNPNKSIAAP